MRGSRNWRGRGNDLQHSVLSAGIITGPDLRQDTSQQLPTRPGTDVEFKDLWLTDMEFWASIRLGPVLFIDTVPIKKKGQ